MAATLRGSTSLSSAATSWAPTKPAATRSGDLLLMYVHVPGYQSGSGLYTYSGQISTPAGWTALTAWQNTTSAAWLSMRGTWFYKFAGASEPASWTVTPTDGKSTVAVLDVFAIAGGTGIRSFITGTAPVNTATFHGGTPATVAGGDYVLSLIGITTNWTFTSSDPVVRNDNSSVAVIALNKVNGTATSSVADFGLTSCIAVAGNTAPNAPVLNSPANNATIDRTATQRFAWNFSDPDAGDSQSKFDLQYRVVTTTPWTTVSDTTPNAFYDFAPATFAAGNYEWQVRTYDSPGAQGPWSSSSFFTVADAPAGPTITAPVNGATVNNTTTLTWSAPNQTDYQWRRVADNAGSADTSTVYQDSGDVVDSTTRSVTVAFDTNNRYEHIQVRIKNAGLWSSWADARVLVSFTPPTVATFTMAADPTTATRTLTVTNPAPGSGVPATSYNDVYVRTAASSTVLDTYRPYSATGTRIGTQLATNTAFVDRTPAGSPVVYEYRVVSVASNGTTSDSGWVSTG